MKKEVTVGQFISFLITLFIVGITGWISQTNTTAKQQVQIDNNSKSVSLIITNQATQNEIMLETNKVLYQIKGELKSKKDK